MNFQEFPAKPCIIPVSKKKYFGEKNVSPRFSVTDRAVGDCDSQRMAGQVWVCANDALKTIITDDLFERTWIIYVCTVICFIFIIRLKPPEKHKNKTHDGLIFNGPVPPTHRLFPFTGQFHDQIENPAGQRAKRDSVSCVGWVSKHSAVTQQGSSLFLKGTEGAKTEILWDVCPDSTTWPFC